MSFHGSVNSRLRIHIIFYALILFCICDVQQVYICRKIAEDTGGSFSVAMNSEHLNTLLMKHTTPPPDLKNQVSFFSDLTVINLDICTF